MALVEGCKHAFEITVPAAEVEKTTEEVVIHIQSHAQLPGFRRGKVPASMIRRRFESDIRREVMEKLVPQRLREEIQKEDLRVVGQPEVTDIDFGLGKDLHFKVSLEVAPSFELGEYYDLATTYSTPEVTEQEIDERLQQFRQGRAEFVNLDPRPIEDGDFAVVSLEEVQEPEEDQPRKEDEIVIEIGGEQTLPGFSENLRGMSPGETKDFPITYPDDFGNERLAGKTLQFHVDVKGIRRKEMPELNDDFAKDVGDYQSLEELRDEVRKSIYREKEGEAMRAAKDEIVQKLAGAHDFALPDVFVNAQVRNQLERQLQILAAQGVDLNQANLDFDKLRENNRESAIQNVKAGLILDKIADREGIHATTDEVDAEVHRLAARRRVAAAALRAQLEKEGSLGNIAGQIVQEKTLNFLFDKARKQPKQED